MKNKHGSVLIRDEDGDERYCAGGDPGANYDTLCGISTSDDMFTQSDAPEGARINCASCHAIWALARTYKRNDFSENLKS
jgi:hypothetical protein